MRTIYFLLAILDCVLGFAYTLNDEYVIGISLFICAFLMSLGINKGKHKDEV